MFIEKTNKNDVLTVGVFERLLNQVLDEKLVPVYAQIDALESKMMDRFNIVFKNFERLERRIDDLVIRKVDREEFLVLHGRVVSLEKTL